MPRIDLGRLAPYFPLSIGRCGIATGLEVLERNSLMSHGERLLDGSLEQRQTGNLGSLVLSGVRTGRETLQRSHGPFSVR